MWELKLKPLISEKDNAPWFSICVILFSLQVQEMELSQSSSTEDIVCGAQIRLCPDTNVGKEKKPHKFC